MEAIVKTTARGYTDYVEFETYEEALEYHNKFLEYDNVESSLYKTRLIATEHTYDDFDD